MEDVLFKFILYISLPYVLGMAARAWLEIRFFLISIFSFTFLGLFLGSVFFQQSFTIGGNLREVMLCAMVFAPLGYITAPLIIKHIDTRMEKLFASDEFDATYRKYAQRHKETFYGHFETHQAETRAGSSTSYERYSQYRRSQSGAEETHTPPQQDYRSDKDRMLDVLEISDRNASAKDLKSAYRKLAWKFHPDILAKNELSEAQLKTAEQRMKDINSAYDWLEENGFA